MATTDRVAGEGVASVSTADEGGDDRQWGWKWAVGKREVRERNRVRGGGSCERKKRRKHEGAINPERTAGWVSGLESTAVQKCTAGCVFLQELFPWNADMHSWQNLTPS